MVIYQGASSDRTQHAGSRRRPDQSPVLRAPLHRSALRSGFFEAAWSSLHGSGREPVTHRWLLDFPSAHVKDSALHSAFAAVSFARIGQRDKATVLIQQSHVAYSRALLLTNSRLSRPETASSDETLACILLLALFEVRTAFLRSCDHLADQVLQATHGSDAKSTCNVFTMLTHIQAARALVQYRGVSAFDTSVSCSMMADLYRASVGQVVHCQHLEPDKY